MAEQRTCRDSRSVGAVTGGVKTIEAGVVVVGLGQRVLPHTSARRDRSTVALCDHNGMGHGGNTGKLSRSTKPSRQHRISHITAGGVGGARTRDRQIMRSTLSCRTRLASNDAYFTRDDLGFHLSHPATSTMRRRPSWSPRSPSRGPCSSIASACTKLRSTRLHEADRGECSRCGLAKAVCFPGAWPSVTA
jgi:hypothetical protein